MAVGDSSEMVANYVHSSVSQDPLSPKYRTKHSQRFSSFELVVTFLSLIVYIADIITDILLGIQYIISGHIDWGVLTITLCVIPLVITQLISYRWMTVDQTPVTLRTAIFHCCMFGVIERYLVVLQLLNQKPSDVSSEESSLAKLNHHQSDICLLRLFESFLESAPQLLLQLYVMHELGSWHPWTGVCAFASLFSLAWGIASYARTMRNAREDKGKISFLGMVLQACWRTGTVMSRVISLLICASVIHTWFLLAFGIHWMGMTIWVVRQHTDLCSTAWEEKVYNAVVGVIYCFCFFNLKEGQSRHRAMVFYTVTAAENVACLSVFMRFSEAHANDEWLHTAAPVMIIAGSLLGHTSQLVYYRWFHPAGPITMVPSSIPPLADSVTIEVGPPPPPSVHPPAGTLRTLKYVNPLHRFSGVSLPSLPPESIDASSPQENAESSKAQINNNVEADTEVAVEIEPTAEEESPPLPPHSVPDEPNRVISVSKSDSRLLLKISPVRSISLTLKNSKSEGHILPIESLERRLRDLLATVPNGSGEDHNSEEGSVCASVHDYENMAAINVNRTDWGVRHWSTYSDIEASYHDNSMCRERDSIESSLTSYASASEVLSATMNDSSKISIQEAISQLKSLAVHGYNVYQPSASTETEPDLYEYIWLNGSDSGDSRRGIVIVPVEMIKPCPTNGCNLSTITEESEVSSVASTIRSTRSKSSLVLTVDTIMDGSLVSEPGEEDDTCSEHLTYVEVSFLSKLDPSDAGSQSGRPKRQFSILRDKFEGRPSNDKENVVQNSSKSFDQTPRNRSSPLRQSTLSPQSRIFTA